MRPAAVACLLAALGSAPAFAQFASRIPRDPDIERPDRSPELRKVFAAFGDCIVQKHHEAARTYVLRYIRVKRDDPNGMAIIKTIADPDCLLKSIDKNIDGGKMTFPGDTMRYELSDALFRVELRDTPPRTDLKSVAPLEHAALDESEYLPPANKKWGKRKLEDMAKERTEDLVSIAMSRFGECVVRGDTFAAYTLLKSDTNSAEETIAFAGVAKSASACIDQGQTIPLNKSSLRGAIAFNYYRLAHAPRVPGSTQ
jgi:hypothetical protein